MSTTSSKSIFTILRENRAAVVIIGVCLLLLELEVFVVAAMKSGRHSRIQVISAQNGVIYEADGDNLSSFDKYYFEKTFGPLDQYQLKLVSKERPFPFRAWFTAAFGIPVGLALLFAFLVKMYAALFLGDRPDKETLKEPEPVSRLENLLLRIGRFNIFAIGFLMFMAIFAYWAVPNMVVYIGRVSLDTLVRYKWIWLTAGLLVLGLAAWFIYLRYLLARQSIQARTEVEKYRLELEFQQRGLPAVIEYDDGAPRMVAWRDVAAADSDEDEEQGIRLSG